MYYKNVALITGASSGIGQELAKIHAWRQNDLVIVARREKELMTLKKALEEEYKINVYIIVKDLSLENACWEIYNELKAKKIFVKYLINNAGLSTLGDFNDKSILNIQQMIDVNITALVKLTKFFLKDMMLKNDGKILNISSIASFFPGGPMQSVYFATKAFVSSFSHGLSAELSQTKISVTNAMPGATRTEFEKVAGAEKSSIFNKAVDAKIVAIKCYDAMMKGKLNVIAGVKWYTFLGIKMTLTLLPKKISLNLIKKIQTPK